jgi:hypothetical protein
MTRFRAAWAGLASAALSLLCTAVPAAAAPTLMAIQNAMTGRCLASNGPTIYTTSSCGGDASLWYTVAFHGGPAYAIKSYASGSCIRINPVNNDIVRGCGNGTELWYSMFNGRYDVIRNYGMGLVLDSDFAGDVHARSANCGLFQQWHWIVR